MEYGLSGLLQEAAKRRASDLTIGDNRKLNYETESEIRLLHERGPALSEARVNRLDEHLRARSAKIHTQYTGLRRSVQPGRANRPGTGRTTIHMG